MTTDSNVRSIQGEHTGVETAKVNFTGTNAELAGDDLPSVGDEQEFVITAICKRSGLQLIDDAIVPFRTMKVTDVRPGGITKAADLEDPALMTRDDVAEG